MSQEISESEFRVGLPARLLISNIRGSVVVNSMSILRGGLEENLAVEEGLIKVCAVKHLESGSAEHTNIEMYQEEDGQVVLKTHFQEGDWLSWFFSGRKPCKIDYVIQVPATCDLKVKGVSSSVEVEGLAGDVSIKTVSGKLTLRQIQGHIESASVSGRIDGEALTGPAFLDTVSGDVHLKECNLESIEAKSISANLVVQTPLSQGPYHFKSVSGNVRLMVPPETGCEVSLKHISGRFDSDLPVDHRSMRAGVLSAQVQSGGPEVNFRTTSGKLRLSLMERIQPTAVQSKPVAENNFQVLEQIASGEISVEEGLKKLQ